MVMKCEVCMKNVVLQYGNELTCSICSCNYHVRCTNLSKYDYKHLSETDRKEWICVECVHMFPFNHISDDRHFLKMTMNSWSIKVPLNCNDMIFNPFDMKLSPNDCAYKIDECDPDFNYFSNIIDANSNFDSKYYDVNEFNDTMPTSSSRNLSLFHCNIRSANSNSGDLSMYLASLNHNFDIIGLSETWLSEKCHSIDGFSAYDHLHKYRDGKRGGGVSLLIHNNIQYKELDSISVMNDNLESLFIEVKLENSKFIVGCVYRPPGKNLKEFNIEMNCILSSLTKTNKEVYIMGDFNIDLLQYKSHADTDNFVNSMMASSFIPLINRPTRVTEGTATIIDNIFTNSHDISRFLTGILPTDVSDHFPIFCISSQHKVPNCTNRDTRVKHIINTRTLTNLNTNLQTADWSPVIQCDDTNIAYNNFVDIFRESYDRSIPRKQEKRNNQQFKKPWMTNDMLNLIREKNKMYKIMKISGSSDDKLVYRTIRNKVSNILKLAERKYYSNLVETNRTNLSKMWDTLNSIINKKKRNKLVTFHHNGNDLTDAESVAKQFNYHFKNAPLHIYKSIPAPSKDPCSFVNNISNTIF